MADIARFTLLTPMRCHENSGDSPEMICGDRALWTRASVDPLRPEFFCELHRRPTDSPLPLELVYRRVSIVSEVVLAGASRIPSAANIEALARLDRAVRQAGGILNLTAITATIGRYSPSVPVERGQRPAPYL